MTEWLKLPHLIDIQILILANDVANEWLPVGFKNTLIKLINNSIGKSKSFFQAKEVPWWSLVIIFIFGY